MSHRIIISSMVHTENFAATNHTEPSSVEYSFTFMPSHNLTEQQQNKRIAKIRRVLDKLAGDVTAATDDPE